MVGVRLTEIWFKCWMVALVRLRHEWDFFLTFENNYRVYWAWTKYCIFPLIGQIFRPNHPTDQRQALIGCWWRPLDNDNIPNICSLPPLPCPQSWCWWGWRRRPGAWWLAGPGWPRVMGTSVSPLPSTLYLPSLLIIPTGCHTTQHNTTFSVSSSDITSTNQSPSLLSHEPCHKIQLDMISISNTLDEGETDRTTKGDGEDHVVPVITDQCWDLSVHPVSVQPARPAMIFDPRNIRQVWCSPAPQ